MIQNYFKPGKIKPVGDDVEQEQICWHCNTEFVFDTSDLIDEESGEIITEFEDQCVFCGFIGDMLFKIYH